MVSPATGGHEEASKREKLGLPLAPLWLIEYCEITEYAPYDLLEVPRITSTYYQSCNCRRRRLRGFESRDPPVDA